MLEVVQIVVGDDVTSIDESLQGVGGVAFLGEEMSGELGNVVDNALDAQWLEDAAVVGERIFELTQGARKRGEGEDGGFPFDVEAVLVVAQFDGVVVPVQLSCCALLQAFTVDPRANF